MAVGGLGRLGLALCLLLPAGLQAAQVSVPDTTTVYDTTLSVPVRIADVAEGVVAIEVELVVDRATLHLDSLAIAGSALEAWLIDTLRVPGTSHDTLRVVAATAADSISGDTELFSLEFTVPDVRAPEQWPIELRGVVLNAGSPAATTTDGLVTLVGADGVFQLTPDTVLPNGTLELIVEDVDADTDGADTVPVVVTLGGDTETVRLDETTPGRFEGSLGLVYSAGATAEDGLLQAAPGNSVSACYADLLDVTGVTVERCASATVLGGADGAVAASVVVQPGDTLRVRIDDTDEDVSPSQAELAQATVTNRRTGEHETVLATETGTATAVFLGGLPTLSGDGPGDDDDGILLARKGDTLDVDYTDLADGGTVVVRTWPTRTVEPFGDASGNGNVRGFDASLVLDHSVGALTLTGLDSLAANLDLDAPGSPITAYDASLILQQRVGLLTTYPVQSAAAANHPQAEDPAPKPAVRAVVVALQATAQGWSVVVDAEVHAGQLEVRAFDGVVEPGAQLAGGLLAQHRDGDRLRIAFASVEPHRGALVHLRSAGGGRPRIEVARFDGGRLVGTVKPDAASTPPRTRLLPATPNPFNPTTTIPFQLRRAGPVEMRIVNALGQTVRLLFDGTLAAGSHDLAWDGRDDAGRPAAAGLYLYRLQSLDGRAVGKMTLAK